jgi:hypothetical protein
VLAIALADHLAVMLEAEPRQVFDDRGLVLEPRSLAIVILDAKDHLAIARARRAPDVQGVDHMAEMQMTGRRRRKPCQHVQIRIARLAEARRREGGP